MFASMRLGVGESPVWLARQMGHRDLTMTSRTDGRVDHGCRTRSRKSSRSHVRIGTTCERDIDVQRIIDLRKQEFLWTKLRTGGLLLNPHSIWSPTGRLATHAEQKSKPSPLRRHTLLTANGLLLPQKEIGTFIC